MKTRDLADFAAQLTAAAGRPAGKEAAELIRLARSHQSLMIAHCNRQLTEREEKRMESLRVKIHAAADLCNCRANCGGDPRGYTVKLIMPHGAYNTWGGAEEGYGVPCN